MTKTLSCYDRNKNKKKTRKNIPTSSDTRSIVSDFSMSKEGIKLDKMVVKNVSPLTIKKQQDAFIDHMNMTYSPDANKYIVSFRSSLERMGNIDICNHGEFNSVFKNKDIGDIDIRIGDIKLKNCVPLKSKAATDHMLSSLRNPNPIDIDNVLFPIQLNSNCWFNTWFVAMFISDKGKKFTRFLREKMITGRLARKYGPHMKHTMKLLNLCIECSYNRGKYDTRYIINTNSIIRHMAESSVKEYDLGRIPPRMLRGIYFQGDGGNPVEYYRNLLYHLVSPADKFSMHNVEYEDDIVSNGKRVGRRMKADEIIVGSSIPDVLNIRTYGDDPVRLAGISAIISGVYQFGETIKVIGTDGKRTNYVLDSIIIRDIDKNHFIILFTCNKTAYMYDGELSPPVMKYNWKKEMIKEHKKITLKYDGGKINLTYKIAESMCEYFYYRV